MKPMGITARRLSADLDVSPSRISGVVNGTRPITADTALRLGLYFEMEVCCSSSVSVHAEWPSTQTEWLRFVLELHRRCTAAPFPCGARFASASPATSIGGNALRLGCLFQTLSA